VVADPNSFILGFDLGTTSFKAALYDRSGNRVAEAKEDCQLSFPQPGWAEQNPDDWWHLAGQLTAQILSDANIQPSQIAGISFAAQVCGLIPLDSDAKVLSPAMIWLDTRSHKEAGEMVKGILNVKGYGVAAAAKWLLLANGAPNISGRDFTSKAIWLRENKPDIWAEAKYVIDIKDFLILRCTGQAVTSPDCAHLTWLMNSKTRNWSPTLLQKTKIDRDKLAKIQEMTTEINGGLSKTAATHLGLLPQTPVICGAGDISAAALGAGTTEFGEAHINMGTSNWIAAHIPKSKVSGFTSIGSVCAASPDRHLLIAAQENCASAVVKVAQLMGLGDEPLQASIKLVELAGQSPAGASQLVFLPWLFGERVPIDDTLLRGGFLNLSLEHTQADMARATLEGLAYNQLWAAEHLFRMAKTPADYIVPVLGGLANSDLMMQIMADVFNRKLVRVVDPQWAGTRGAFFCAGISLGWYASFEETTKLVKTEQIFTPNAADRMVHQNKFTATKQAYKNNRRWYKKYLAPLLS
jgi:xylulokinase